MSEEKKDKQEEMEVGWWGGCDEDENDGDTKVVGAHLYFYSPVTAKSILSLNQELRKMEIKLLKQAAENSDEPHSIKLHIHSYGGSIFAGVSGMEAIRKSRVPVTTIVDGAAASAATFLSTAGNTRLINKDAYMLIHQLSSGMWGKFSEFEDNFKNLQELMDLIKRMYRERARIPEEELEEMLKHDLWFTSQKCLEYGLVDRVV